MFSYLKIPFHSKKIKKKQAFLSNKQQKWHIDRLLWEQDVAGSTPAIPTNTTSIKQTTYKSNNKTTNKNSQTNFRHKKIPSGLGWGGWHSSEADDEELLRVGVVTDKVRHALNEAGGSCLRSGALQEDREGSAVTEAQRHNLRGSGVRGDVHAEDLSVMRCTN